MESYIISEKESNVVCECEVMYERTTKTDVLDNLTVFQQRSLQVALNQLDSGHHVPHSEVVKMSKSWLKM